MGRAEDILAGLNSLKEEGFLCDVELDAGGKRISAHRVLLAAKSQYFKSMFSNKFKESKSKVVYIKEITFPGLKNIVDSIYTAKITLDETNIKDVLPAAHLFQMTDVIDEIGDWMMENVTITQCFTYLQLAEKFNMENVIATVNEFILANFATVSAQNAFNLISKEALIKYISSDTLNTGLHEFVVYKAANNWITANKISHEEVDEILSFIRFALITPNRLVGEISHDPIIRGSAKCQEWIGEATLYHTNLFSQPLYNGKLNRPRGKQGLVLIPGEIPEDDHLNSLKPKMCIDFVPFPDLQNAMITTSKVDIPLVIYSMCSAQINNFLYIFGANCKGYQNFTMRYNASTDSWLELAAIPRHTAICSGVAHWENQIFCIGGLLVNENSDSSQFSVRDEQISDEIYGYNIVENGWSKITELPTKLLYAATICLESKIYLSGGYLPEPDEAMSNLWAYDLNAKVWLTKAPMNEPRFRHVLEKVNSQLFVLGGRGDDEYSPPSSIEIYNPLANQWSTVRNVSFTNNGVLSFVIGQDIFLVGGEEDVYFVYVYNTDKKTCKRHNGELPSECCIYSVSDCMVLPKLL